MKNRMRKLLAFLIIGCIAVSGCGAATVPTTNTETEETSDDTQLDTQTETVTDDLTDTESGETTTLPESTVESSETAAASEATIESSQTAASSETNSESSETHNFVGIITDATNHSITVQSSLGNTFYMTIPESGVSGNLDFLTIGQMATITYSGSLDENHATLVGISSCTLITGIYVEEYAFAIKIINAVKAMDKDKITDLTNFPVFLDTGDSSGPINDANTFKPIDTEKIFTEELVERMANYNLFDLKYTEAGFVMGNGGPNITFDVDDDGILGIIGINSTSTAR